MKNSTADALRILTIEVATIISILVKKGFITADEYRVYLKTIELEADRLGLKIK